MGHSWPGRRDSLSLAQNKALARTRKELELPRAQGCVKVTQDSSACLSGVLMNIYSLISDEETESERLNDVLKITQQDLGLKPGHSFRLALVPKFLMLLLCGPFVMVTAPCRAYTRASSAWTHTSAPAQGQASAHRPPPSALRLGPALVPAPPRPLWRQVCCPPAGDPGTPATRAPPQA